jgi:hypothetical protein
MNISDEAVEACRACTGPQTVQDWEDVPLCDAHWDRWLARYLNSDDLPPCGAHRIRTPAGAVE